MPVEFEASTDGVTWVRWSYEIEGTSVLKVNGGWETFPVMWVVGNGVTRTALVSPEVAADPLRMYRAASHVTGWQDEAEFVPATRLYVWGLLNYVDGGTGMGLVLMVIDFEGVVQAMVPVPEAEQS
jgi:hypothetical protein